VRARGTIEALRPKAGKVLNPLGKLEWNRPDKGGPYPMIRGAIMKQKRRCHVVRGTKIKPITIDTEAKIYYGIMQSKCKTGYDWPVRKLRRSKIDFIVTIPYHVREYFDLEKGDRIIFAKTTWSGLFGIMKVKAEMIEDLEDEAKKDPSLLIRKVQGNKKSLFVNVPRVICEMTKAEDEDTILFSMTHIGGVIGMCVIKVGA